MGLGKLPSPFCQERKAAVFLNGWIRINPAQGLPILGAVTSLLKELTLSRLQRRFAGIHHASGKFPCFLPHTVAELANHYYLLLSRERDDVDPVAALENHERMDKAFRRSVSILARPEDPVVASDFTVDPQPFSHLCLGRPHVLGRLQLPGFIHTARGDGHPKTLLDFP
jgi:hypothetical protein